MPSTPCRGRHRSHAFCQMISFNSRDNTDKPLWASVYTRNLSHREVGRVTLARCTGSRAPAAGQRPSSGTMPIELGIGRMRSEPRSACPQSYIPPTGPHRVSRRPAFAGQLTCMISRSRSGRRRTDRCCSLGRLAPGEGPRGPRRPRPGWRSQGDRRRRTRAQGRR